MTLLDDAVRHSTLQWAKILRENIDEILMTKYETGERGCLVKVYSLVSNKVEENRKSGQVFALLCFSQSPRAPGLNFQVSWRI